MATVQDFVAQSTVFFDRMDTAVTDLQGDVDNLTKQIADLKANAGGLSPTDQAALDAVSTRVSGIADKLDALDALTPPAAPTPAPTA